MGIGCAAPLPTRGGGHHLHPDVVQLPVPGRGAGRAEHGALAARAGWVIHHSDQGCQ